MSDTKSNLFVNEDEDMLDVSTLDPSAPEAQRATNVSDDDDPIIHSIPIFHSAVASRQSQTLHAFQFPGRRSERSFAGERLLAQVKPISKVVELKVPMDTLQFYDESRTQELGTRVDRVALQGVLDPTNENLYVGAVLEREGQDRVVLFPLDNTAQLRPLFKYIDDFDAARSAQMKNESATSGGLKQSAVQVLQTASKMGQGGANGPLAHGEGLCLKHVKQFNEELWEALSWHANNTEQTKELNQKMITPLESPVEVKSLFSSLIEELLKSSAAN